MNLGSIYHRSAYSDCYPIDENSLRINLRTGKDIQNVTIIHNDPYCNGITGRRPWEGIREEMEKRCELPYHILWSSVLTPEYKREQYYFELTSGEETIYMLEDGFYSEEELHISGKMKQYFKIPWLNPSDVIRVPDWVSETVWYEIVPDRFCRGDYSNKRMEVKPWDDKEPMTYEDFYGGDLKGIISKLGYLEKLGITGIYLTPIFESESNHKYDTTDYHKIDPDFGTEQEMKELIMEAHKRGIKVMVDGVFNHCGTDFGPWKDVVSKGKASSYYDWFFINKFPIETKDWKTRDGRYYSFAFEAHMPKLNTNNPEVMEYFINRCKYWVNEWKIDGIRFDVGNEISHTFIKRLRREIKGIEPDLFLLGEIWHDSTQWLQGDEYDSVMNYPFIESIHDFWNTESMDVKELMLSLNRIFTMYPEQITNALFQFLDSHDVTRAYTRCGNLDTFLQQFSLLCTMPGSICLYYGTELGMEGAEDPYNRKCMPWREIEQGKHQEIFEQIQRLIAIRKRFRQCRSEKMEWILEDGYRRLLHYRKLGEGKRAVEVYMNAGKNNYKMLTDSNIVFAYRYKDGDLSPGGILILQKG